MRLIFNMEYIKAYPVLFWIFAISLVVMIILSIIFVRKETKNEYK